MTEPATSFGPRVRRLRRRLLVGSLLASLAGVGLLAGLVTWIDAQANQDRMISELDRRATAARSLIYYDEANELLQIDGLLDDEAINGSPQVYAVEVVASGPRLVFGPAQPERPVAVLEIASESVASDARLEQRVPDAAGVPTWVVARPFYHDTTDEVAGAVVVTESDATTLPASRLVLATWLGAAVLVGLLALGSALLIRRSLAPAAHALAQQERFVGDAAHELRRPLAAIRATAERGLSEPDSTATLTRTIDIVDDTSRMVDDLLALARLDVVDGTIDGEPLRLDQLVETAIGDLVDVHPSAPAPELRCDAVTIAGDTRLLRQAVQNLVVNAWTHAPGSPVEVAVARLGRGAIIEVGDHGPGFGDAAEAVFARFGSGAQSPGSGLGLALVDAVASAHGGTASARNRAGGGASVELRLPRRT